MRKLAPSRLFAIFLISLITACGGGNSTPINNASNQAVDVSGNWTMTFTDASNNKVLMSAFLHQVGTTVNGLNLLAAGNAIPPFSCLPFSGTFANGALQNLDQFSGDIQTSFGNVHFAGTVNTQGTHAQGTYSLTGTCWGVAGSGTFSADQIPSVTGSWTGSINCMQNCPGGTSGLTSGIITASLTQDNSTGAVTGTYSVTGTLPGFSSGTVSTGPSDFMSGSSWQSTMTDKNGSIYVMEGGPFFGGATFVGSPGLLLDGRFLGVLGLSFDPSTGTSGTTSYAIQMKH